MSAPLTIHLIGNAHLDPVWLWDWREGMNEGIATCRAMVALLREFPAARFIRGEAAIYEYIERHDPPLFAAIRRLVAAGRWDIVGGTYIQSDNNLPATEAMLRQFVYGKNYFREKFGVEVTAAWSADCFGHAAGLSEIFAAAGMTSFAFTRPWGPIPGVTKPAFWWRGASGARILCYRPGLGWYGTERDEIERRLDACLADAGKSGLEHVACFHGLGNHGGGPTRVQLRQIEQWAARHPEVCVMHSGLHELFAAIRDELRTKGDTFLPEISGEINFCLRGCSASVAKFKFPYRRAEAQMFRAERTSALVTALLRRPVESLANSWRTLLFNAFHDVLPGTAIERAFDDQIAQVGGVSSETQRIETDALMSLAREIDTRAKGWTVPENHPEPVPVLLWNPHPWSLRTQVEIEVPLDHRPLWNYRGRRAEVPVAVKDASGRAMAAQVIAEEHDSMGDLPWRARVVVPVTLSPLGWKIVHVGLGQTLAPVVTNAVAALGTNGITNGKLSVSAEVGAEQIAFQRDGETWLGEGLSARVYEDVWGAWGGMNEEPESWQLTAERERWRIDATQVLEAGPERAALWVRLAGARSRLELTFLLARDSAQVRVNARVLWTDRSARLKLVLPCGGASDYEVPGGVARREPCGEVPGGRWVRAGSGAARVGFASDALYGFDTTATEFRATVVRATRYASDAKRVADDMPWLPVVDAGELRFSFLLTPECDRLPALAAELEEPPVVMAVPTRPGKRPATGTLIAGLPASFRLLALCSLGRDGVEFRVQNTGSSARAATITWLGQKLALGRVARGEIATWRFTRGRGGWRAKRALAAGGSAVAR